MEGEDIRVLRVPLADIHGQIAALRNQGYAIDVKILLLLGAGLVG